MKGFLEKLKSLFKAKRFLCDSCRYDYRGACTNLQRPNVTECPDYKKR